MIELRDLVFYNLTNADKYPVCHRVDSTGHYWFSTTVIVGCVVHVVVVATTTTLFMLSHRGNPAEPRRIPRGCMEANVAGFLWRWKNVA